MVAIRPPAREPDMRLPSFTPRTEIWVDPPGYSPKPIFMGGVCPVSQLLGHVVIDWWSNVPMNDRSLDVNDRWVTGEIEYPWSFSVQVWKREDHPNLKQILALASNLPRRVRSLYQADFQLRLLRETGPNNEADLAREAWAQYWKNRELTA